VTLSPEQLVHRVADLAVRVRDGEPVAAELAAAARQLSYAFDTARRGLPAGYRNLNVRRPAPDTALSRGLQGPIEFKPGVLARREEQR
jgi:hypothetical protein